MPTSPRDRLPRPGQGLPTSPGQGGASASVCGGAEGDTLGWDARGGGQACARTGPGACPSSPVSRETLMQIVTSLPFGDGTLAPSLTVTEVADVRNFVRGGRYSVARGNAEVGEHAKRPQLGDRKEHRRAGGLAQAPRHNRGGVGGPRESPSSDIPQVGPSPRESNGYSVSARSPQGKGPSWAGGQEQTAA